jgi:GNAT superfamily N-acetyltransferase
LRQEYTLVTTIPNAKDPRLTIRTMVRQDIAQALDWAAAEGWNPGIHDAACFQAADPAGFFLAEVDGESAGCIAAVSHDESFGWLGLFIVRPEFRGRGIGLALWNAGLAHLGGRTVGLDGVESQQANYAKSGFRTAHRDIRYESVGGGASPSGLVELSAIPFAEVLAYDRGVSPAARPEFLRRWVNAPDTAALGVLRAGRLAGFGVMRPCRRGHRIGPLFGDDEQIAEDLFGALSARATESPVCLDVPEANPAAVQLARRHGMREVFATARMYSRQIPHLPLERIFGVTSMEVG